MGIFGWKLQVQQILKRMISHRHMISHKVSEDKKNRFYNSSTPTRLTISGRFWFAFNCLIYFTTACASTTIEYLSNHFLSSQVILGYIYSLVC